MAPAWRARSLPSEVEAGWEVLNVLYEACMPHQLPPYSQIYQHTHSQSAKKGTHTHALSHREQNKQTKAHTESFVERICDRSKTTFRREMYCLPTDW